MATLYDKIWNSHEICKLNNGSSLIYIDRHLIQDVTSPQAFEWLKERNMGVCCPELSLAIADHNASTNNTDLDFESKVQVDFMRNNCQKYGIKYIEIGSKDFGIVHVVAPELGLIMPGSIIVCGDSHTSTHGAFGSLAFGIGTKEVEHVLATQTLVSRKLKNLLIKLIGKKKSYITAKDIVMHVIAKIGVSGGNQSVIEYFGNVVDEMSMEARMTLCNMTIEAGATSGIIAPDDKTIEYLFLKKYSPKKQNWEIAVNYWKSLKSDGAEDFDNVLSIDVSYIKPQVTWGTTPATSINITDAVPSYEKLSINISKQDFDRHLDYMGIKANQKICGLVINKAFIGSCTNSRLEDIRSIANVIKNKKVHQDVHAIIVPGSYNVKVQAEKEGLDRIFKEAGFEWRNPGCSMCIGINADRIAPYERCASTSNRNFEGRQGYLGRTHLMSPIMVAAAAIEGKITDVREHI